MHDNTQSIAYGSTGTIRGGYMRLIEKFQAENAPFVGYLHSEGFCVARTDAMPTSRVTYRQKINGKWSDPIRDDILNSRLKEMQDLPGIYAIESVTALSEKHWYQLSKAGLSGIRKAAEKIRRKQGFGNPYLMETVESDGRTTTYVTYG